MADFRWNVVCADLGCQSGGVGRLEGVAWPAFSKGMYANSIIFSTDAPCSAIAEDVRRR